MNLLDAAYHVVSDYPGGAHSLAPRMGKAMSTLSHELTSSGTAKLGLMDAEKITTLTGDLRILAAFAANCGQMIVPLPHVPHADAEDCMKRLAATVNEFSQLMGEVSASLADGSISDNEMERIDRESGELIASLHHLREALSARNLAGKPQAVRGAA